MAGGSGVAGEPLTLEVFRFRTLSPLFGHSFGTHLSEKILHLHAHLTILSRKDWKRYYLSVPLVLLPSQTSIKPTTKLLGDE